MNKIYRIRPYFSDLPGSGEMLGRFAIEKRISFLRIPLWWKQIDSCSTQELAEDELRTYICTGKTFLQRLEDARVKKQEEFLKNESYYNESGNKL